MLCCVLRVFVSDVLCCFQMGWCCSMRAVFSLAVNVYLSIVCFVFDVFVLLMLLFGAVCVPVCWGVYQRLICIYQFLV